MHLRRLFALIGASDAVLLPFLPVLLHDRGLTAAQIGVTLSLAAAVSFLAAPLWGYLADRALGGERTLVLGALAAASAAAPLPFVRGFASLTVVVLAVTAARSGFSSLVDSLALQKLQPADYGRVRLWQSIGWAVAACVWGLAFQTGSLHLLPLVYAVSLLGLALAAHSARGGRPSYEHVVAGTRRELVRSLAPFLVSLALLFVAFSATFSFVAVRMAELGGGLFVIGVAAALQAVAETPVMQATPRLSRAVGHRTLYVAGTCFVGAACFAWAFLDDTIAIALVKLVVGVGFALVYVGSVVLVDDLAPPGLRGTAQGLSKAVSFGLAPVVGTLVGGAVYDYAGPRALFLACAGAALAAGLLAVREGGEEPLGLAEAPAIE